MINLDDLARGMGARLESIAGLRVHEEVPQRVVPPCAVLSLGQIDYDSDLDGAMVVRGKVLVLTSATDAKNAQRTLRDYQAPTGDWSVYAAVHASPTLPVDGVASCDFCRVTSASEPSGYELGAGQYLGVEFEFEAVG